jgi:hypothetical protein
MHFQILSYLYRRFRRFWYKLKRKRYMTMRFFDRFKWCVIGGFAYTLGRFLFDYLQGLI